MKTMILTNDGGSVGITMVIILMASVLIGATAASVIMSEADGVPPEEDLAILAEQVLEETLDEITTYIQIPECYGKYYEESGIQKIKRIALEIKSMISKTIDLSDLTVKLYNGDEILTLFYSGYSDQIGSNSLFRHSVWNNLKGNDFGFIVSHDNDNSIVEYNAITENTDRAYLAIQLPDSMAMSKGDSITVKLVPITGIIRSIELIAPLPINSLVIFE